VQPQLSSRRRACQNTPMIYGPVLRTVAALLALPAAQGFVVTAPTTPHAAVAVCRSAPAPQMGVVSTKLVVAGGVAVAGGVVAAKRFLDARPDPKVADYRASLAGMESLKGLSELSLEREEGRAGRVAGEWKEYIKADGRKWYYNTESGKMQWAVPEEFAKLDEVAAAAAEKNAARGA